MKPTPPFHQTNPPNHQSNSIHHRENPIELRTQTTTVLPFPPFSIITQSQTTTVKPKVRPQTTVKHHLCTIVVSLHRCLATSSTSVSNSRSKSYRTIAESP
ncbi:hypothetical protein MtrunA17_Chr6g0453691 [Medicago truncatula]|uniref:Uncharacterized protein n=1 Tax=Medicago truncatula TaxID=3880 RepID=A0A396HBU4_MEDTR|nr:hypothetical protein MtrunA17_Chr6g0453691 [Medicago truncatula]